MIVLQHHLLKSDDFHWVSFKYLLSTRAFVFSSPNVHGSSNTHFHLSNSTLVDRFVPCLPFPILLIDRLTLFFLWFRRICYLQSWINCFRREFLLLDFLYDGCCSTAECGLLHPLLQFPVKLFRRILLVERQLAGVSICVFIQSIFVPSFDVTWWSKVEVMELSQ